VVIFFVWGALALVLLAATWTWRSRGGLVRVALQALWTLWLVEMGARAVTALQPAGSERSVCAWTAADHGMPELERRSVPAALLSLEGRRPARSDAARVLVVGDSFAAGEGVGPGQDIASQLATITGADVRNHGLSGLSFFEEAALYDDHGRVQAADVVVWLFVLNDLGSASPGDALRRAGLDGPIADGILDHTREGVLAQPSVAWGLARDAWRRGTVAQIVESSYQRGYDAAASGPDLDAFEARLGAIQQDLASRDARLVFAVWPILHHLRDYPFAAAHAELLLRAARVGAEAVDLADVFSGQDEATLWASVADHHPNAAAQAEAAAYLAGHLGTVRPSGGVVCPPPATPLAIAQQRRCAHPEDPAAAFAMAQARLDAGPDAEPPPFQHTQLALVEMHEGLALAGGAAASAEARATALALLAQIDAARRR